MQVDLCNGRKMVVVVVVYCKLVQIGWLSLSFSDCKLSMQ